MNKKGQFFLIAAVLFCLAIFSITIHFNKLEERALLEDFQDLSQNYANEAPKVVNSAIEEGKDAEDNLDKFTEEFLNYARKKDPNIGFFYVYLDPSTGKLITKNFLQTGDTATIGDKTVFSENEETINKISLSMNPEEEFSLNVPTKVKNFDESYTKAIILESVNAPVWVEIGGIFYRVNPIGKNLNIIAKTSTPGVDSTTQIKIE